MLRLIIKFISVNVPIIVGFLCFAALIDIPHLNKDNNPLELHRSETGCNAIWFLQSQLLIIYLMNLCLLAIPLFLNPKTNQSHVTWFRILIIVWQLWAFMLGLMISAEEKNKCIGRERLFSKFLCVVLIFNFFTAPLLISLNCIMWYRSRKITYSEQSTVSKNKV